MSNHSCIKLRWVLALLLFAPHTFAATETPAKSDIDAWLRYSPLTPETAKNYLWLPNVVEMPRDSAILANARNELVRGLEGMLGRQLRFEAGTSSKQSSFLLGTLSELHTQFPDLKSLEPQAFQIKSHLIGQRQIIIIAGGDDVGVLYGVFQFLGKIARGESITNIDETQSPYARIRWVDQWDNLDGRIERGYGGPSIFFADNKVRDDLTRAGLYARLLASIGINGCTVNNVNADPKILGDQFLPQLKRIADVFRPWGVHLSISVDLSSPKALGDLDTFDPLDNRVEEWWRKKANSIYEQIPDFGGFVMKADSEGRAGPSTYGRTAADAANVIARALKPHGSVVFYRAFVYNHHLDWHDMKADRARAAYDIFHPLDGSFDDNVIVQIKNGPIDFQVREPVSPLFAGLQHTNEAIELQITQEYTGQQRHLCFLIPMWKEALDFDMRVADKPSSVKAIVAGRVFSRPTGGLVGVANVGMDENWMGSPMALANLYGFGRLAWNPDLSAQTIADEWTRMTFGNDPLVVRTISSMQLASWKIYEDYTGSLGAGTLTNITGNHYDPAPESSERNGWGQWHRADHDGIGMDRTIATGTGYVGQYPPAVQKIYETLAACPDELLLFFQHVAYTYKLHSGKTVIQHVYDSHYEGAEKAASLATQWEALRGHMDDSRFQDILARLQYQAREATVWRDTVCNWIHDLSGIADEKAASRAHSPTPRTDPN